LSLNRFVIAALIQITAMIIKQDIVI